MSTMQPTTSLRFIEKAEVVLSDTIGIQQTAKLVKVLQQKWIDIDTGEELWVDVPLEDGE